MNENKPFEFQVGDIVSFGGVEGVVEENLSNSDYPIRVKFINGVRKGFTFDGRYDVDHTESLLKLVSRPQMNFRKDHEYLKNVLIELYFEYRALSWWQKFRRQKEFKNRLNTLITLLELTEPKRKKND